MEQNSIPSGKCVPKHKISYDADRAGFYQSLSHAITLASLGDHAQTKEAVLFLSPQWFRKAGVQPEAFTSRFSESHYIAMLKK